MDAFVHHLLIVGGRAVRIAPPGALAEIAPRRAARPREGETFFILVSPTADSHASAALLEELAQLGADVFFGSGGGITGALREALTAINVQLAFHPDGPAPHVNALALALREDQIYAARAGRTFAALTQPEGIAFLPADRSDPLEINLPPLGAAAEPDIQLGRYTLAPGQMMLIADAGLLEADDRALADALAVNTLDDALERLKALAGPSLSASVIRFLPAGAGGPPELAPQVSPRAPRHAPQPVQPPPLTPVDRAPAAPPAPPPAEPTAYEAPPAAPSIERPRPVEPVTPPPAMDRFEPEPLPDAAPPFEDADDAPEPSPATERLRGAFSRVTGSAGAITSRVPRPQGGSGIDLDNASVTIKRAGRDALRVLLRGVLAGVDAASRGLSAILPEPDADGRGGIPTNVAVATAIIIPVVIVVAVVGLTLSERGRSEFENYLERAAAAHSEALAISGTTGCPPETRPKWEEVLFLVDQAREFRPDDLQVMQIRADAMNYLDCFDRVQRRDLTLLHEFDPDADLIGPIVHNGVELYVLDRTADAIYHDTLNETGTGLTSRGDTPILRRGQAVSGFTLGEIIDIEWLRSGGTTHDNVLIALDSNGVLVAHSWTFGANAQQLVIDQRWIAPNAIAVFRENLYVLDPGANQVWRYVPPTGERRYSNAPEEYFTGADRPDLSGAVDIGISETGEVFVLYEDGTVNRYLSGKPQEFAYSQKPEGALHSGATLFVDNDREARTLFIVDPASDGIYETSWAGTFQRGFRPRNLTDAFEDVTSVYADTVERNNMYVLAGGKLYHFPRN